MLPKCCFIVLLAIGALLTGVTAQAQPPASPVHAGLPPSLQFASEDTSFYYALTNNRLKWDAIVDNPVVQRLLAMPVVQRAIADAREEFVTNLRNDLDEEGASAWGRSMVDFWTSQEGQSYLPSLVNLASRELFIFAEKDFAEQLTALNAGLSTVDSFDALDDLTDPPRRDIVFGDLQVPRVVAGAKLSGPLDQQRVRELLNMLDAKFRNELLNLSDAENKYILDSLVHLAAGEDDEKWVLHLVGDDYPWDAAIERLCANAEPEKSAEVKRRFTRIRDDVADKSLVVSVGFADGYLFASIGHDPDEVNPSKADQPLYQRDVFKPLMKNRGKSFSRISYRNSEFQEEMSWIPQLSVYLRLIIPTFAKSMLSKSEREPESYQSLMADIEQDVETLLADLNRLYNPAGDQLAFSFLFDGGIAGYHYHRHTDPISVQAQTLKSLEHIGEHPAWFRATAEWEEDGTLNQWLHRIQLRTEQIMDVFANAPGATEPDEPISGMNGVFAELFLTTKDDLLPSLGNEAAFVLDFERRSQQWHPAMPPAENALPIPAAALVYDLADAKQHRRAWRRYFDTINSLFAPLGRLIGLPPGPGLPAATQTAIPGGVYLQVPGVQTLGVDAEFSPGLASTDEWAVYTLFRAQGVDLVNPHSPPFPPPLSDISRPLIAAGHIDFLQFADAAQVWLDYATPLVKQTELDQERDAEASKSPSNDETTELFAIAIDLLRQMPSYTHATYIEDNAVVTQSVLKIPTLRLAPAVQK